MAESLVKEPRKRRNPVQKNLVQVSAKTFYKLLIEKTILAI